MTETDPQAVRSYLIGLQDEITRRFEAVDGRARFQVQDLQGPGGSLSRPRVTANGAVFEKAAVHFTHALGEALPPAATEERPALAGAPFEAVSLSLITHPENPYVPTSHMNLRFFQARPESGMVWWFGGGFDLTPFYGFDEDVLHWHRTARDACNPLGPGAYPRFKRWCDQYFYLAHRKEPRGVGGLFFDDLAEGTFDTSFAFVRSVGDHYLPAYLPIVERRKDLAWGDRERQFQLYRRGRYVEFNLVYDRGTRYGLQSGRRVESVLASMPPLVRWEYEYAPEPGSREAELTERYLVPRDWLTGDGKPE